MARTVPETATKASTDYLSGALWNAGSKALGDFLLNVPAFRSIQSTAQSLASGSWTAMALNSTGIDSEGGHSDTVNNSRYTCQVAGWYWVEGYFATNGGAQTRFECLITKNAAGVAGSAQFISKFNDLESLSGGAAVQLAVGDYVEVWGRQNSGTTLNTFPGTDLCPSMNVFWIHA
jgi:hypothetical protein